ncbi:phage major capsid protein [Romboutsia sp.]|uniref:phage major capsid protein n=1 Tax=Romboutsia sp. TaxID=1965302 RepID=UPI002BC5ACBA|nr:phage major capsid protein [Romboutsia sp.]HSQ88093.1 phage major capsid protein [Romboutsia sp.]
MKIIEILKNKKTTLLNEAMDFANAGDFENAKVKREEAEKVEVDLQNAIKEMENIKALQDNHKVTNLQNTGVGTIPGTVIDSTNNISNDDMYASLEYRKAFMNHVIKGAAMPGEFLNVDTVTKTTDIGTVIPTTVMEKIVQKLEATGMILPLVTRTAYKGGVSIPTSSVKPVATWVAQGAGSDKQSQPVDGAVTFAYHKLRCAVAVTLETDVTSLAVFESTLINNITDAMIKAIEQSIISGTGTGQPKGILAETPVAGQLLDIVDIDYKTLIDAEAALPLEYETDAVYCMTKKTFMAYTGITDSAGQPIARVNYGIGGKPERTLLGRQVILCNYLDSFSATLEEGKVFAFLFNFKDYVLNTNFNMGIKKYEDNDTDDLVTKSVILVDGKVVEKNSLVVLKKKAAV